MQTKEQLLAEIITITSYQYYLFSTRDVGKATLICTGAGGKTIYVHFMNDTDNLQPARKIDDSRYALSYRYADMPGLVDMLRNEKPVYLVYVPTGTNNTRLSTGSEPVGEGEQP